MQQSQQFAQNYFGRGKVGFNERIRRRLKVEQITEVISCVESKE